MPKIEQTIADVKVRSHTFKFISPAMTEALQDAERVHDLPHRQDERVGDRGAAKWPELSPWRVATLKLQLMPTAVFWNHEVDSPQRTPWTQRYELHWISLCAALVSLVVLPSGNQAIRSLSDPRHEKAADCVAGRRCGPLPCTGVSAERGSVVLHVLDIAFDPATSELGVGVQSRAFGAGAAVPYAKPGVGAVATQASANRRTDRRRSRCSNRG